MRCLLSINGVLLTAGEYDRRGNRLLCAAQPSEYIMLTSPGHCVRSIIMWVPHHWWWTLYVYMLSLGLCKKKYACCQFIKMGFQQFSCRVRRKPFLYKMFGSNHTCTAFLCHYNSLYICVCLYLYVVGQGNWIVQKTQFSRHQQSPGQVCSQPSRQGEDSRSYRTVS